MKTIAIVGIVIAAIIIGVLAFMPGTSDKITGMCVQNSDCVPSQCCHPTSCVPRDQAPDCTDVMCTMHCAPGTMDCGQGYCACIDGTCIAVIEE